MSFFAFQDDFDIKEGKTPRSRAATVDQRLSTATLPVGVSHEETATPLPSTATLPPRASKVSFLLKVEEHKHEVHSDVTDSPCMSEHHHDPGSFVNEIANAVEAQLEVAHKARFAEIQERQQSLEVSLANAETRFAQQLAAMKVSLTEELVGKSLASQGVESRCNERIVALDSKFEALRSQVNECSERLRQADIVDEKRNLAHAIDHAKDLSQERRFNDLRAATEVALAEARRAITELVATESRYAEQLTSLESRCYAQIKQIIAESAFGSLEQKERIADSERGLAAVKNSASERIATPSLVPAGSWQSLPTQPMVNVPVETRNVLNVPVEIISPKASVTSDPGVGPTITSIPSKPLATVSVTPNSDDPCGPRVTANPSPAYYSVAHRLKATANSIALEANR